MNLIMKCVFGSHLYQLNTPSSDKDYKGIYLPTKEQLLLHNYPKSVNQSTGNDNSKNTKDDVDSEIFSLPYFIELALKGETVAIDMLHAENMIIHQSVLEYGANIQSLRPVLWQIWNDLKSKRTTFYTKDMKSYAGYARKQANKYGIKGSRVAAVEKVLNWLFYNCSSEYRATTTIRQVWSQLPTNEYVSHLEHNDPKNGLLRFYEVCGRKYQDTLSLEQLRHHVEGLYNEYGDRAKLAKMDLGVDWKAVSHALRASYQMLGILKDGDFEYPLPQTEFLLNVKTGKLNFVEEVQPELDNLITEIETLALNSSLPAKSDYDYWDQWLLNVYERYLL